MLTFQVRLRALLQTGYDRATREDAGATAVEYGLLIGFVALAIVAALLLLGPRLAAVYQSATDSIPAA